MNRIAPMSPAIIIRGVPNDTPTLNSSLSDKIDQHLAKAETLTEFANYEILGEVARGGVGIIYRARQHGLERVVALKVLQSGSSSSEHVQRFLHEAKSAAKLQHQNIVPIHDFGTQDGLYFFTMDFVEGEALSDRNGALLWSYEVGGQIRHTTPQVLANKLVFIATGPPENGLYCLRGDCVRENARAWFGPWRSLSLTK